MSIAKWQSRLLAAAAVSAAILLASAWLLHRRALADLSDGAVPATLTITSANFSPGGEIPQKLTCDGANVSPALALPVAPSGTKSFALVMDDLDAPLGFVHWLAYDIPPGTRDLAENAAAAQLPPPARQGINSFRTIGYRGPCPPSGQHRYRFSLYAVGAAINLPAGVNRRTLSAAIQGHILARGQIIGLYRRAAG